MRCCEAACLAITRSPGLGVGVWGVVFGLVVLGLGVWGWGFGAWGLGFQIWGLRFRVRVATPTGIQSHVFQAFSEVWGWVLTRSSSEVLKEVALSESPCIELRVE